MTPSMLGNLIKPLLKVPASLACQLPEVSLEVILVVTHPALTLEPSRHTCADVVQWKDAAARHIPLYSLSCTKADGQSEDILLTCLKTPAGQPTA